MWVLEQTLLHEGLKKRKRSKIKVPTKWACNLEFIYDNLTVRKELPFRPFTNIVKVICTTYYNMRKDCVLLSICTTFYNVRKDCVCCLSVRLFTTCVKIAFYSLPVRLFTTCVKIAFYSLSPDSLRTMVLMRKDVLYEYVKTYVMRRKEDPYAFFTQSLRTRKFNFSCCGRGVTRDGDIRAHSDLNYVVTKQLTHQ